MFQRQMTSFLRRLKTLRKKARLTQQDVANRLKLNQATYSAMEGGRQSIILNYLFEIASTLGIPVWQLFVDANEVSTFEKADQPFFAMWQQFNTEERDILKAMASQISKRKELEMQIFNKASPIISSSKSLGGKIKNTASRVIKRMSKNEANKMAFKNSFEGKSFDEVIN